MRARSGSLPGEFKQGGGADVAGHDQHGVAEIHLAALAVGQAAVLENLQQDVEDVRVRLFDFVEQHHGIRTAADCFGELAALFVAHIAWRRADHARDGVLLHVLGHVQANHGAFVVEEKFREGASQFRLADAGGPQENERADGPVGIGESGAIAADGVGDASESVVLADDALAQALFHGDELLGFAFEQAADGDAGPLADQRGDIFLVDFFLEHAALLLQFGEALLGLVQLALGGGQLAVANFRDARQFAGASRSAALRP